jgi:DNA repair exonuclease SbcCD ATPase subunit
MDQADMDLVSGVESRLAKLTEERDALASKLDSAHAAMQDMADAAQSRIKELETRLDKIVAAARSLLAESNIENCPQCEAGSWGAWKDLSALLVERQSTEKVRLLDDGFGNMWYMCKRADCGLEVVRPGKVQCGRCEKVPIAV